MTTVGIESLPDGDSINRYQRVGKTTNDNHQSHQEPYFQAVKECHTNIRSPILNKTEITILKKTVRS